MSQTKKRIKKHLKKVKKKYKKNETNSGGYETGGYDSDRIGLTYFREQQKKKGT